MVPASQSDQGTRWLERTIAAAPDPTDAIRAQALLALDAVRSQQQQLDLAQDLANDAMHMYKRLGDRVGEAHRLNGLELAAIDAGRSDEAEELLKTTVAICEETRDAQAREVFLLNMGVVCLDRGDWARARDIFAENLSFARANHDDLDVAMSSENLWEAHLIGGEPDKPLLANAAHLARDLAEYHRHGQRAVELAQASPRSGLTVAEAAVISGAGISPSTQAMLDEATTVANAHADRLQEAASHADPRTTMRYDRARGSLDRHATYIVAAYVVGAAR